MFQKNDYIVYGTNGVCKVKGIGALNMTGSDKNKLYYTLEPLYANKSTVFTPVDNEKVPMRNVISREEASRLIESIPDMDIIGVKDNRKREEAYKQALYTCECADLLRLIKTLHIRKRERIDMGKPMTSNDERYLRMAEDNLYGEFAITLEIPKENVEEYIAERVDIEEL